MAKINIIEINDLHFGIADTEREKEELQLFLDFIKNNPVDLIHFNGDYFDHKMSLSDPSVYIGLSFFNDVLNIAKEKNIKIRMLEGTKSHDMFQPRIFDNFILDENGNKMIDYKFFETLGDEDVLGLKILYVPEEYPMNIDEYYAEYKKKQYDLMFVHGTWDFINFGGTIDNSKNDINSAPVFKYDEWKDTLEHGLCVSGHIHGRHGFKDKKTWKIVYPGSFTAWSFDQISDRGFIYITVDTDTHENSFKFIDNPKSPKYANLDINDLGCDLEKDDIELIKKKIEEQKQKVDFLKVDINSLSSDKKLIFKQAFKDYKGIKVEAEAEKIALIDNKKSNLYEKYDYLLADNLSVEQATQRFIKEDLSSDIDLDKLTNIITETK